MNATSVASNLTTAAPGREMILAALDGPASAGPLRNSVPAFPFLEVWRGESDLACCLALCFAGIRMTVEEARGRSLAALGLVSGVSVGRHRRWGTRVCVMLANDDKS